MSFFVCNFVGFNFFNGNHNFLENNLLWKISQELKKQDKVLQIVWQKNRWKYIKGKKIYYGFFQWKYKSHQQKFEKFVFKILIRGSQF